MITFLVIWNVALTGWLIGLSFASNGHQAQLNRWAIDQMRMQSKEEQCQRSP